MQNLYPLLMLPGFDPRPWGTEDLSPIYPNHKFAQKIGEAWLSGDECKVANGPLTGKTLAQLSEQYERELVGDAARDPKRFPLLLKFLFPHEKLSVQVHPDDQQALRVGQPWGKTECWYVAHAKPGSQIGLGLKPGVTAAQLEAAIHENRAEEAAQLGRCLYGRHDLRGWRHGSHTGTRLGDRRNAAAIGYDLSFV